MIHKKSCLKSWILASKYVTHGHLKFLTSLGLAFRPILKEDRMDCTQWYNPSCPLWVSGQSRIQESTLRSRPTTSGGCTLGPGLLYMCTPTFGQQHFLHFFLYFRTEIISFHNAGTIKTPFYLRTSNNSPGQLCAPGPTSPVHFLGAASQTVFRGFRRLLAGTCQFCLTSR